MPQLHTIIAPQFWEHIPNGDVIRQKIMDSLADWWPRVFGYHLLKLGSLSAQIDIQHCTIPYQFSLYNHKSANLQGIETAIPLQHASVDVVLSSLLLEFNTNPYLILREIDRVLVTGGYLFHIGFNPLSPLFMGKVIPKYQQKIPWNGHFYLPTRVKDWLALLGYKVIFDKRIIYHPLFGSINKGMIWQQSLQSWLPSAGSVYILVAKKLDSPLTPIREKQKRKRPNWSPVTGMGKIQ